MFGLAGFLGLRQTAAPNTLNDAVRTMAEQLRHRGPDGAGTLGDETAGIALGT